MGSLTWEMRIQVLIYVDVNPINWVDVDNDKTAVKALSIFIDNLTDMHVIIFYRHKNYHNIEI